MLTTSHNGWPIDPDPRVLDAVLIEPIRGRKFWIVRPAAPLFSYVIRRFHREVDPITGGVLDDWSFNFRQIPGTGIWSNHASASAVDLNATHFPMGLRLMNTRQRQRCQWIVRDCRHQIRWGGDWSETPDEMHFELAPGTKPASVRDARIRMGLHPDGRVLQTSDLFRDHHVRVPALKRALTSEHLYPRRPAYTSTWTPELTRAWHAWRDRHPDQGPQERLDSLGARTGRF